MQHPGRLRLVVDTNVWFSHLFSGSFAGLVALPDDPHFVLLLSPAQLDEMLDVLYRDKLLKRAPTVIVHAFISDLIARSQMVNPISVVNACRDPKDNYLLALAKDGRADLIITGDKELLVLRKFLRTRIIGPTEFLKKYD